VGLEKNCLNNIYYRQLQGMVRAEEEGRVEGVVRDRGKQSQGPTKEKREGRNMEKGQN